MKINYLLPNFLILHGAKGDGARSPSFTILCAPIQASSASLETLIATSYVQWDANQRTLTTANKCLFSKRLLFVIREGEEAAFPSFTTSYVPIEASSASLETLIASWYLQWGCKLKHFTHEKEILVCQSLVVWDRRGW